MQTSERMKVAVIGGGAAGFFAAIHAKINHPEATVILFEKTNKVLSKVKVSGGGRCNVTNGCSDVDELCQAYPRGGRRLKKLFHQFNTTDTQAWFNARGVSLYTQDDQRVFPVSDDSQTIVDCLQNEMRRLGVKLVHKAWVTQLVPVEGRWRLHFSSKEMKAATFDYVIVASGGSPRVKGLAWLASLGHKIEIPVPSLFTFNMPDTSVTQLMGVAVENVIAEVQGTKLSAKGPLLITHWGMSGPAILKLSAFGARILHDLNYTFKVRINWAGEKNNELVRDRLKGIANSYPQKQLVNQRPFEVPRKLWTFLLDKYEIPAQKQWQELGKKWLNRLTNALTNDVYDVNGTTTFKEEFVTCGGVSLDSIDLKTMQSRSCPNLYFAGEVLDIDGITGGYNFQAAWTTGFIAGQLK